MRYGIFILLFVLILDASTLKIEDNNTIRYSFEQYISQLLSQDNSYINSYLETKITHIKNINKESRYNFNLDFVTSLSYDKEFLENGVLAYNSNLNSEFIFQKKLYDGQKNSIKTKKTFLEQRLSELNYLKKKEQMIVLGLHIYKNLLILQEQLRIEKRVKKDKKQLLKDITKREKILKKSEIDRLIIENEILNIDKNIISLVQLYKSYIHIFKQTINFNENKKIRLGWIHISKNIANLLNIKKMTLLKNSDILISENILKLSENKIVMESKQKDWEIDFESRIGYRYSQTKTSDTRYESDGMVWQNNITFKYPIFQRDDRSLNIEVAKLETLQKKNLLNQKQKDILNALEERYTQYEQFYKLKTILKQQSKIVQKISKNMKQRYLIGLSSYSEYSREFDKKTNNEKSKLLNNINIISSLIDISLLSGNQIFGK